MTTKVNPEEIVDLKQGDDGKWGQKYAIVKVDEVRQNPPPHTYISKRTQIVNEFLGGFIIGMEAIERVINAMNRVERKIK